MAIVKRKVLRAVNSNLGLQAEYKRCLQKLIDEMNDSVSYWISSTFRNNEPEIAQDELPASALKQSMRKLSRRWMKRFNEAAPKLARFYSQSISKRTDASLKQILDEAGFTVKWKMTRAQRDVLHATVQQNVALIKSIPQKYLTDIEGAVMRSVQSGRDLHQLTKDIKKTHTVTRKRAHFIAKDQTNKATSALVKARWQEVGIQKAKWRHSHAGEVPRPTHLAMDGKIYEVTKGMYDKAVSQWIQPGELPNCRCTGQPIIEGFS